MKRFLRAEPPACIYALNCGDYMMGRADCAHCNRRVEPPAAPVPPPAPSCASCGNGSCPVLQAEDNGVCYCYVPKGQWQPAAPAPPG